MKSDQKNDTGEIAAKVRQLGMTLVFAPVDFSAWLSSNRSNVEIEEFIAGFEKRGDDGSANYKNNMLQIAQYRAGTLKHSIRKNADSDE